MKRFKQLLASAVAATAFACSDAPEYQDTTEGYDDEADVGQLEQPWRVRPGETSTGRTWGVRQNTHDACANSGSFPGVNCYWFSATTVGSGENRIKYALVDNFPNDFWASDEAARFVADLNEYQSLITTAALGSSMAIVFENVPTAQAKLLIKPFATTAVNSLNVDDYGAVQFDTSSCNGTFEGQTEGDLGDYFVNKYFRCSKATIKFAPTELLMTGVTRNWGPNQINAARKWIVFSLLHGLLGIGKQSAHPGAVTAPAIIEGIGLTFLTNEEKCRLQTLQGAYGSTWPGLTFFSVNTASPCAN